MEGAFLYASILTFVYLLSKIHKSMFSNLSEMCLILILFILSVEMFYGWLYASNEILNFPHLIRLNTPFVFVIGPAIFFYVSFSKKTRSRFYMNDSIHLLPLILVLIYFFPLYISSGSEKINYINNQLINKLGLDSLRIGGLRRVHQFIYILFILRIIWIQKRKKLFIIDKAGILTLTFVVLWTFDFYRYFFDFRLENGLIDTVIISVFLLALVFKDLIQNSRKNKEKYSTSGISLAKRAELSEQIHASLKEEKLYINNDLDLFLLAKALDIQPAYLSQVLNQDLKTSFSDLINSYRVKEAKKQLLAPENNILTIEAIAKKSGFKSGSTFNFVFKKFEGITPSQYKKSKIKKV